MALIVIATIAAVLFAVSFIMKRRFGVLGLALCAGAFLADTMAGPMGDWLNAQNIQTAYISQQSLAKIVLTLLPAGLLLFGGPHYEHRKSALLGSAGFALLGTMLLLGPLSATMHDPAAQELLRFIADYESWLTALGVALAVVDMMLLHTPKFGRRNDRHRH